MLSGLSALKNEIAAKKRSLEDKSLIGEKKYFKRGELLAKEADEYWIKHGGNRDGTSGKDISPNKNASTGSKTDEANVQEAPALPRAEVLRRLRERDEPILLFGESEEGAFRRLRRLEILEPEINRGLRNDFQEALERVDQAYLNEILKNQDGGGVSRDVALIGEEITMESIKEQALELENGSNVIKCKVVLNFVQLILQIWGKTHNSRLEAEKVSVRGKMDSATYTQTQTYLKPLIKGLKKRSLPEDIMECLVEIVENCIERDYVKANDVYLQMAIGNAAWPIGVTMVGIHARTGREKIFSKHVAHVLNDETQRKYIQGLKRLMTKCQDYFIAAPSKCVEYRALAPL
ncbi:unnamed protein product [Meganyctiphanes norvegica]|uniref:Pre-mRNA-splicing factor 18 n=1 Tax=Meganyctiphanes norvegica TaxID=48144 RepID=A0AAV2RWS7_MEGNR